MYKGKRAFVIQTIVIAAAYVALTIIADLFGMGKDIVQVRIADALCVLPYFTPAAIPALFIGCIIANISIGCILPDVIFGSIATLVGAFGAYFLRKYKFAVSIPSILLNTATVVLLFKYAYRYEDSTMKCILTVGIGEIISCGILGSALILALEDNKDKLFPKFKNEDSANEDSAEDSAIEDSANEDLAIEAADKEDNVTGQGTDQQQDNN